MSTIPDAGEVKARFTADASEFLAAVDAVKSALAGLGGGGGGGGGGGDIESAVSGAASALDDMAEHGRAAGTALSELLDTAQRLPALADGMYANRDATQAFGTSIEELGSGMEELGSGVEETGQRLLKAGPAFTQIAQWAGDTALQLGPVTTQIEAMGESLEQLRPGIAATAIEEMGTSMRQLQENAAQALPLLPQFADSLHSVEQAAPPAAEGVQAFTEAVGGSTDTIEAAQPTWREMFGFASDAQLQFDKAGNVIGAGAEQILSSMSAMEQGTDGASSSMGTLQERINAAGAAARNAAPTWTAMSGDFEQMASSGESVRRTVATLEGEGGGGYTLGGFFSGLGDTFGNFMRGVSEVSGVFFVAQMGAQVIGQLGQSIYNAAAIAEGPAAHSFGSFTGTIDALGQSSEVAWQQFSESFGRGVLPLLQDFSAVTGGGAGGGFFGDLGAIAGKVAPFLIGGPIPGLVLGGLNLLGSIGIGAGPIGPSSVGGAALSSGGVPIPGGTIAAGGGWAPTPGFSGPNYPAGSYVAGPPGWAPNPPGVGPQPGPGGGIPQLAGPWGAGSEPYNGWRTMAPTSPGGGGTGPGFESFPGGYGPGIYTAAGGGNTFGDFLHYAGRDLSGIFSGAGNFFGGIGQGFSDFFKGLFAGPEGATGCFPAGTQITLANGGTRPIEDVTLGDRLVDGEREEVTVHHVFHLISDHHYVLTFSDGGTLKITNSHPISTTDGWKSLAPSKTKKENPFLAVTTLQVGDHVHTRERETVTLEGIQSVPGSIPVYNISVSGSHSYYADGVLVHNKIGAAAPDVSSWQQLGATINTAAQTGLHSVESFGSGIASFASTAVQGGVKGIQSFGSGIESFASTAVQSGVKGLDSFGASIMSVADQGVKGVVSVGGDISGAISGALSGAAGAAAGALSGIGGAISGALSGAVGAASGALSGIGGAISGALSGAVGAASGALSGIGGAISGALSGAVGAASGALSGVAGAIGGALSGAVGAVAGALSGVPGAISGALSGAAGAAAAALSGVAGAIMGALSGISGAIPKFAGGVENFSGGLALVGEHGPELLSLPRGSSVYPMSVDSGVIPTITPLSLGGSSGGGPVSIQVIIDSTMIAQATLPALAPLIRVTTGRRSA